MHVDLDGALEIYEGHGWGYDFADDPIFESGLRGMLALFAEQGVTATLFVVARTLADRRKRALLDEAVRQGHEIASHTLSHRYLPALDAAGKRREIGESRRMLEGELGVPVLGFRAPGYRIDRESLEILAECGYGYDSSAFPSSRFARALGSSVAALRAPHEPLPGSPLVEWPMPLPGALPLPFNPSYALLLGDWLFRQGVARHHTGGSPLTLLFHLIDVAEPLPADRLRGLSSRIFTLSTISASHKLRRCSSMLAEVRRRYRVMSTTEAIAEWRTGVATVGPRATAG